MFATATMAPRRSFKSLMPSSMPWSQAQLDPLSQVSLDAESNNLRAMEIRERIRRRRLELGLTLKEVGQRVGVTKNAVHLWETGSTAEIALDNRIKLSEVLDIPLVDLLPPSAANRDVVIRDPQEILLIERFRLLSPPQREVYLRLMVVMHEDSSRPG